MNTIIIINESESLHNILNHPEVTDGMFIIQETNNLVNNFNLSEPLSWPSAT